ncbi:MerR family transcriptional regulator [Neobacillus fumarioli]|uniref:MerR family transcriptional regulator n=1 Tax=Neobacillus fumarioli TaxID=105229 RepID=UPI00082C61AB|nr:MerR family transcriptional regulator [Neobacillus fumarioli]
MYTISEIADLLGVSPHTLRYYEKEKIVVPDRDANGNRVYRKEHFTWLRFVIQLKQTQMPIAKIRKYTELYLEGDHTTTARLALLEEHQRAIQEQLHTLTATEKMLSDKIESYKQYIARMKNKQLT